MRPLYLVPLFSVYPLLVLWTTISMTTGSHETKNAELFHRTYVSSGVLNDPVMVLVLHGDAPFTTPSYQYAIARKIANENNNTIAVGVLRPGYTDMEGNRSKGERGLTTGDNYTVEVLKVIHGLSQELIEKYNPAKVILVGHSGGAAIAANMLTEYSGYYSGALLISCPCDLHPWRIHMKGLQPESNIWDIEVDSPSPIEGIKHIDDETQIGVIHGDHDETVPIALAHNYVEKLRADKKNVDFTILENQGHEIAFDKKVFEIIKTLIE